jgi:arylsulfatase A-like enzyme
MASYKATARLLDQGMGAVLNALDANGLAGNTLVICTTDHGIAWPSMKCNLTDDGIGVMLIMRGPGGFEGGRICDALVSHIDISPTLCDLLDIEAPDWLQGTSLLPWIRDEATEVNEAIFADITYHAAYEPQRAVRTQRWKYIRHFGDRHKPVLSNCDDSLSKSLWLEHGWAERHLPSEQLFDLVFDPQETCNVAGDPLKQPALEEMRARLDDWMERTNDPLLRGPVPAPSGARINDQDAVSPGETPHIVP